MESIEVLVATDGDFVLIAPAYKGKRKAVSDQVSFMLHNYRYVLTRS